LLRKACGDVTLADLVRRQARRHPSALALEVGEHQLDYRELGRAGGGAAAALRELGARPGDVVALIGRNSIGYVAALLGAARSGITLALVHPELSGQPLRQALAVAGARYVLCEEALAAAIGRATALPRRSFDPESREPFPLTGGAEPEFALERRFHDFALVFTSGTTGVPKACRLPHSRVMAAACLFGAPLFDYRRGDKLLCPLPLHHGSPLMLGLGTCFATGTPLVLERRFSARELMRVAARTRATALLYVGDLGRLLLATPEDPSDTGHALRVAVGNGMAAEIWPKLQARFGITSIREFYAATESPVGILNLSGRVGSVGNLPYRWLFGSRLARLDDDGELVRNAQGRLVECGVDELGELLIRARRNGVGVYHGYADPSASEARLVRDAFRRGDAMFRTHDVLRRDRAGFYYFVERRGDSYRFRGENVAVALVEQQLALLPGVREAVVSGVEVPGYDGRVGLAVLVAEPGFDVQSLTVLAERLPRSALPRFVRLVPELRRTSTLKLERRSWAADGVDPGRLDTELWVMNGSGYARLTAEAYRDILASKIRL
jgi:fatty-acyl-CoA synthase